MRIFRAGKGGVGLILAVGLLSGPGDAWARDATTRQDATPAAAQTVAQEVELRLDGLPGRDGQAGSRGSRGSSGLPGSTDLRHPKPGGHGGPGGRGRDGEDGLRGGPGPDLAIWMDVEADARHWLRIRVEAAGKVHLYAVDPARGSLTVRTVGGPGGRGGRGGDGGPGGPGGIGRPSGADGSDGMRGFGGTSGPRGRGGAIRVTVTPAAKPFLGRLHLDSPGGPEPRIEEGPWPV